MAVKGGHKSQRWANQGIFIRYKKSHEFKGHGLLKRNSSTAREAGGCISTVAPQLTALHFCDKVRLNKLLLNIFNTHLRGWNWNNIKGSAVSQILGF